MANLPELIIIKNFESIKKGTPLYFSKEKAFQEAKTCLLSKDLANELAYLFNYEINGLCRVMWDDIKDLDANFETQERFAKYVAEKKSEIEKLNPNITERIKSKIEEIKKQAKQAKQDDYDL